MHNFEIQVVDKLEKYINEKEKNNKIIGKRIPLWAYFPKMNKEEYQLRPDIDLLQKFPKNKLCGIEVKVFYNDENKFIFSGIDQALSLYRLGLDYARLFYVFIITIPEDCNLEEFKNSERFGKIINKFVFYSLEVSDFIKRFQLPIGFTPCYFYLYKGDLIGKPKIISGKEEIFFVINPQPFSNYLNNYEEKRINCSEYRGKIGNFLKEKFIRNKD
ncbi:MAG: hypothetical protein ACTSW3_01955 [Promethearchaeota archaeon]